MSAPNIYLDRYAYQGFNAELTSTANPDLIVIIPCYKESDIVNVLDSLQASYQSNENSVGLISVIVVINHPEDDNALNKQLSEDTGESIEQWLNKNQQSFELHALQAELPRKKAGVGLARKIGMDAAVRIFEKRQRDGIIVNLDADCTVSENYLPSILNHFRKYPLCPAASIYFEHPIESNDELPIINYELFLRYFINAQRFCLLPFAFQTIGSSMAVRSSAYQKQGGMNTRKAGEDFYFIQKMVLLGGYNEINDCTVYPGIRVSDRVPFGTGRALMEWQSNDSKIYSTYHPESFILFRNFIELLPELFTSSLSDLKSEIAVPVWDFLNLTDFNSVLTKIKKNSANLRMFKKHFFNWFDGFQLMKYLHYSRDNFYSNEPLDFCLKWLFKEFLMRDYPENKWEALKALREFDRQGNAKIQS